MYGIDFGERVSERVKPLAKEIADLKRQLTEAERALCEAARQLDLAAMNIVDRDTNQSVKQAAKCARNAAESNFKRKHT